ncbi:MAG: ABC transporter ATP-binding protein, partial [Burkholderia sp.]|nr:ABC transporter ATP-binding protein [Burkholderia sp.]
MNVTGRGTPAYPSTTASTAASADTPAASRAPVLELDHVTLELGGRTILRDTGFVVNQGEF